ncbi:EmrB/QacA subfamily drug resistance transporter [Lipingzhangella halophila]|uniref:EmrB/QacA subfamily drug resistance transporter n=1 Tax=Lipingzhangella halophila TaxID=1783352 RepID=A0A7W7REL1_9ACTN|nr:MFS transporter [Lipingzhangella halophila]MBB4930572.1 EmrB/QacA subfamily drug resistance transporter [Lipingzhangella halophila]
MRNETALTGAPIRLRAPRGVAMAGLASAMFLVILDSAMVNLAGPAIREGLGLTASELTIVVDSYLVALAGLLLLGGRLADVLGGRRIFLVGMAVFLAASVLCAMATDSAPLIAGRIGQGIGSALVMPAALSLVLALYSSRAERTRAMGIWGAVAGGGSVVGVFLGGTLTEMLGWQAVFLAPVPFGVVGAAVVWWSVPSIPGCPGRFDALGAATITIGISALALGMVSAADAGWGAPSTIAGLVAGTAALAAFVVVERRAAHPLVPLGVFTRGPVVTANAVMLLVGGTLTSLFYFLPLYQQDVLGMGPLATGMAQLPLAGMIIVGSVAAPPLAKRLGLARAQPISLAVLLAGLLWLVVDPTTSGFSASLLGAFLLIGGGLGLAAVNATAMAVRDSTEGESGLISGLINAAQQLGGAVGLAALAGIAIGAAGTHAGADISFTTAFLGAAALICIAIALSLVPTSHTRPTPDLTGAR